MTTRLAARATPCPPAGSSSRPARRRAARSGAPLPHTWSPQTVSRRTALPPLAAAAAAPSQAPVADAASRPSVRPIQPQPVQLTTEGFVPNTASLNAVPPALQPLLEAAVAACQAELGAGLVGVYLRGSLVQHGCFVPGLSDADFIALYLEDPSEGSSSTGGSAAGGNEEPAATAGDCLRQQAAALQQAFPQCVKVRTGGRGRGYRKMVVVLG